MPTIRIDDEVYQWLKSLASPFEDTPNSVLRRIAKLDVNKPTKESTMSMSQQPVSAHHKKTPQPAYRGPILNVLKKLGGRGRRKQVLKELEEQLQPILNDYDREDIQSGDIRWRKSAEWEVAKMREEGMLAPSSEGWGVWVLTEKGKSYKLG